MRNKVIGALAVAGLLAGCECSPEKEVAAACAPTPGTAEDFKANVKDRVFFAFNKKNLTDESMKTLESQAAWFKTYPKTTAVVEGHTDVRGTREYNMALGKHRSHAAMKQLVKDGVAADRLKAVSYGKDRPFAAGDTEEAHAQNRVAVTNVQ